MIASAVALFADTIESIPSPSTQQLTKILALNDIEVVSIGKKSETLEDYFLKLTGEVKYHA